MWRSTNNTDSVSGQRRRRTSSPPRASDAPSSTAGDDYVEVATRLQIKRGTAWSPDISAPARSSGAARRRSAPSVGRREQGPAGDVSGWQSPVDAETFGPHLAAVKECRRRGRRCRYARRLASPHSPGRHLDCHTVGDRRSGCRSIPAVKHVPAWVRDEVRYLTCIWQVLCYQSFFALSLFWRVSTLMSCRPFYQMLYNIVSVSGWQSPVDAETFGPHLAAVKECRRRGRRCRYARRLASPHSPGRHLDCHTVGDRRSGCRSIPAVKHVPAWVRDEVRYLTCIWQDIWQVLCYQSFFALSLFWRVSTLMSCRLFYQMLYNIGVVHRVNTLQFYSNNAQNLLSKLHEHCLIRFALCRIWNVCRNAALRRNDTFIRRIRCALSPKLNALFSNTSSLILITCDTFEYGCTIPYCRNWLHCFQTTCTVSRIDRKKVYISVTVNDLCNLITLINSQKINLLLAIFKREGMIWKVRGLVKLHSRLEQNPTTVL